MSSVKIKVNDGESVRRVELAREILGEKVDIRVDANGAWTTSEALEFFEILTQYGVSSVEQPLPKDDAGGLAALTRQSEIPIVLDESVCTLGELHRVSRSGFPFILNVRLSKCGGILNLLEMYDEARRNGIPCQLGCQVGETGLLSAVGRQLAGSLPFLHIEGCFGSHLLMEDIVVENLTFGIRGKVDPLSKDGLGVTVRRAVLEKYSREPVMVSGQV